MKTCIDCGAETHPQAARYCNACKYKNAKKTADEKLIPKVEEHLGEPLGPFLLRRYVEEKATFRELQIEMGLGDNARRLKRWLAMFNIRPRGKSEAVRLQHERNPGRGQQWGLWLSSDEARLRMARSRQSNVNLSALQKAALSMAQELGVKAVPELAVSFYNIDLALPDRMVAVELNGGNWHTEEKDRRRDAVLEEMGWKVYRFRDADFGDLLRLLQSVD